MSSLGLSWDKLFIIQITFDVTAVSKQGLFLFSVLDIGHIILKIVNLSSKFVI